MTKPKKVSARGRPSQDKSNAPAQQRKSPEVFEDSEIMDYIQSLKKSALPDEPSQKGSRKTAEDQSCSSRQQTRSCHACADGGGWLLNCDFCPARFHPHCHDPPVISHEENKEKWMCNRCRKYSEMVLLQSPQKPKPPLQQKERRGRVVAEKVREALEQQRLVPETMTKKLNDLQRAGLTMKKTKGSYEKAYLQTVVQPCLSGKAKYKGEAMRNQQAVLSANKSIGGVSGSLFHKLAHVAELVNTTEFSLAGKIEDEDLFNFAVPGQDGPGPNNRPVNGEGLHHCFDSDRLIPRPAKLCFYCSKTAYAGTMAQCDFCDHAFHLDCLDPPLSVPPTHIHWMCPLHVDNFVVKHLLRSPRLSERYQLMRAISDPVRRNPTRVIATFVRKAKRKHPPFAYKRIRNDLLKQKVKVPLPVKWHYKHRIAPHGAPLVSSKKKVNSVLSSPLDFLAFVALDQARSQTESEKRQTTVEVKEGPHRCLRLHISVESGADVAELTIPGLMMLGSNTPIPSTPSPVSSLAPACPFICPHHCTLYFNKSANTYELLSYSPHGTLVDGLLYGVGAGTVRKPLEKDVDGRVREILLEDGKAKRRRVEEPDTAPRCRCRLTQAFSNTGDTPSGWLGPAQLKNGSVITMGCIRMRCEIVN